MERQTNGLWRIDNDEAAWLPLAAENGATVQHLPDQTGDCRSNLFALAQGLTCIETHYRPSRNLAVYNRIAPAEPRMVLTLGLSGHSRFASHRGSDIDFRPGYSTITTFQASEGSRHYSGGQNVTQLRFSVTRSWLETYFGPEAFAGYFAPDAMQVVSHKPCSPQALMAAQSLLHTRLAAKSQPLFRQGQAMAILASELEPLLDDAERTAKPSAKDRRMAEQARDILAAEYRQPPSLAALSKRLGTNQFKLKQLFRCYFDTTPYGMLLDIRMEHAYRLLKTSLLPVALVAEAVGYSHASNFSAAFAKYYGCSPSKLARQG